MVFCLRSIAPGVKLIIDNYRYFRFHCNHATHNLKVDLFCRKNLTLDEPGLNEEVTISKVLSSFNENYYRIIPILEKE
jgi:hypothetical protein